MPIGERRAPAPDNRPGFIRIDSVHQGDQDGVKGVYHINAVDCVTQWELVATCEKLSEAYVITSYSIHYTKLYDASLGDLAVFLRRQSGARFVCDGGRA